MKKRGFFATALICTFLGTFGIHRFFTGYILLGVLQLLTLGGCGIWTLIDWISILTDNYKDVNNQPLNDYSKSTSIFLVCIVLFFSFAFYAVDELVKPTKNTVVENRVVETSHSELLQQPPPQRQQP